ncbi:type II restriction endonuclease subunit M [Streptomyces mashuensis]|uniref:Type II restriction endonuclease subunit M n=1 Tax=Streptomyces mashuensis TaxID=33904 RepID=A0A919AUH3_9ACTN|nr:N-6 DNA methylase [Streptomyces mashuensis]GHF26654.1 type II restriction endonuclease subunit M [Streptomyces mashuensis]
MASARTPLPVRTVPVTLAEIARIAGVGRAAVSNWRRRHDSFPKRIGGSDVSPQFSLSEVEDWLRDNHKLKDAVDRDLLWPRFEALGSRQKSGLAIAAAGRRMLNEDERSLVPLLTPEAQDLVADAARLARREGTREIFDFLLQRWLDAHVRQVDSTPPALASLMATAAFRARTDRSGGPLIVLDPACGTGHLLAAAAAAYGQGPVDLLGCEREQALAELASTRLRFVAGDEGARVTIAAVDSLRADPYHGLRADVALCNPPSSERDWDPKAMATDARWVHGLPPRTEPELAWMQHVLARLRPGGTAVLLLPPAVASRRAGRRIRASLLRAGCVRAVVALPPGAAQPHSLSLHLWVLRAPDARRGQDALSDVLLTDATDQVRPGGRDGVLDWEALRAVVRQTIDLLDQPAPVPAGMARVSVVDLLDDDVNLTPRRHVGAGSSADDSHLSEAWSRLRRLTASVQDTSATLARVKLKDASHPTTTIGELVRAKVLSVHSGQQPSGDALAKPVDAAQAVPLLTIMDLVPGTASGSPLPLIDARDRNVVLAERGDVVVAGTTRAFDAWVHDGPPIALGAHLHSLRVSPEQLDNHFLACCLRAPSNGRQAGTHASSSSRVDVRRLQVLQLPMEEQRRYGEVFRHMATLKDLLAELDGAGRSLLHDLNEGLAAGRLASG